MSSPLSDDRVRALSNYLLGSGGVDGHDQELKREAAACLRELLHRRQVERDLRMLPRYDLVPHETRVVVTEQPNGLYVLANHLAAILNRPGGTT